MAASGKDESHDWNDQFTQSILEWLCVPKAEHQDFKDLPYGNSANDMLLLALRCRRTDEERKEQGQPLLTESLAIANDPERLYAGLTLACLGITESQLNVPQGEQHVSSTQKLRPFEYDARSRASAFVISEWLDMPKQFVAAYEMKVAGALERAAEAQLGDASAKALEEDKKHS
ncbi:hypothetical protein LPJ77_007010, partial [Coemansia sp. RSA 2523]